ncbi:hypothetical protein KVV02_001877 [Mortierella alpina]|uniref:polynucleotide adenylyltransferase n=1 Tax=Mortierella alpina TaxID=64518 RepID=A0A9P8A9M2_MORAP|nr:hypothetical protein KVV02_001877 [Mortierella alpina]
MLPLSNGSKSIVRCSLPIHAQGKDRLSTDHLGQTLVHPTVTLHLHDPQHLQQQQQQRPDSPTSLEDSQSESGVDTLSVDSADSADYADAVDTLDPIPPKRIAGRTDSSERTSADQTAPSGVTVDASASANGSGSRCTKNSPHLTSGLMMATPPLSPTRPQFSKESDQDPDAGSGPQHDGVPLQTRCAPLTKPAPAAVLTQTTAKSEERRKSSGARGRAGSAPPTAGTPWQTRGPILPPTPSLAIISVMPPRIPVPHVPGQGVSSAWSALLPGVAPIRVNPRPIVRSQGGRLSLGYSSKEQRQHHQQQQQQQQQPVPILLPPDYEGKLTMQMYSLFEGLLPTEESHHRRTKLINKIERIVQTEWPGQDIKVLPFGSTVNDLGTNTSDVDICIWTSWLGLQGVEMLAEMFRKHGMENVFCVPEAKVPIVKLWDPELQLSCDMNINTQLGIMNSRMVKTYVAIDPRVRPFAMIIKHWARKRVLNDAANGGTISTYTWICMVINFLQMRSPPILPTLHDMPHELSPDNQVINGNNTSFFSDLSQLEGFGSTNKESLGGLLYAFFRKFAIEFDYDHHVISVRHACYLTKESKGWNKPGRHYRLLCVEEPFDTTRNLGNSCDMASSKGLKQEFRRALDILNNNGTLDQVCEQWVFPPAYYHNNNNSCIRAGTNGHFASNHYAAAGRRYVNGFRSHNRTQDTQEECDADAEDGLEHKDPPQAPRRPSLPNPTTRRSERNGHEKRSRSNSVPRPKEYASFQVYLRAHEVYPVPPLPNMAEGSGATQLKKEEARSGHAVSRDFKKDSATVGRQPRPTRPRQSSIHTSDETAATTLALAVQAERFLAPGTSLSSSSSSLSPASTQSRSSKPSNKSHGGIGSKGSGSQRNGRSGGPGRDGSHGSKGPRAAVELCLADIAKIAPQLMTANKLETFSSESSGAGVDGGEPKKKKCNKKSVLWSTNSNRGESRGAHAPSKAQDQSEQARTKMIVVP